MRTIEMALVGLAMALVLGACRRQPLNEHAVHESLAEKREQYQTEIERGVQSAPPPVEVRNPEQPPSGNNPPNPSPPAGGGVPSYEAPPPTVGSAPRSGNPSTPPPDTRTGDVQVDPTTGQYGIAPPGAPEGYTIPLQNPPSNSAGESK